MNSPFYLTPIPFVKNLKKTVYRNENTKRKLQKIFTGKTIIDLGCGIEENAKDIQELCVDFKTEKYIGVDLQIKSESKVSINKTTVEFIRKDILEYLKSADIENISKVFILFGFEPVDPDDKETKSYIKEMMEIISKKSRFNDIILIGNGTHGINPESFNFSEIEPISFDRFKIRQYVKQAEIYN